MEPHTAIMKKVAISVAPVPAGLSYLDSKAVATDIIACAKAGASELHLHPRNEKGKLTADLTVFEEIVTRVKGETDMVVQMSLGAASVLTIEEKCKALDKDYVELTSLNMTSMNFGHQVRVIHPEEVDYLVERIMATHTLPEIETFDLGDFYTFDRIRREYKLPFKPVFNIGLGHGDRLPATPKALMAFLNFMPEDALWYYTEIGRRDFSMVATAVSLGAHGVRVGMEDSPYLLEDRLAKSNAEVIEYTVRAMEAVGALPASVDEVRKMMGLR